MTLNPDLSNLSAARIAFIVSLHLCRELIGVFNFFCPQLPQYTPCKWPLFVGVLVVAKQLTGLNDAYTCPLYVCRSNPKCDANGIAAVPSSASPISRPTSPTSLNEQDHRQDSEGIDVELEVDRYESDDYETAGDESDDDSYDGSTDKEEARMLAKQRALCDEYEDMCSHYGENKGGGDYFQDDYDYDQVSPLAVKALGQAKLLKEEMKNLNAVLDPDIVAVILERVAGGGAGSTVAGDGAASTTVDGGAASTVVGDGAASAVVGDGAASTASVGDSATSTAAVGDSATSNAATDGAASTATVGDGAASTVVGEGAASTVVGEGAALTVATDGATSTAAGDGATLTAAGNGGAVSVVVGNGVASTAAGNGGAVSAVVGNGVASTTTGDGAASAVVGDHVDVAKLIDALLKAMEHLSATAVSATTFFVACGRIYRHKQEEVDPQHHKSFVDAIGAISQVASATIALRRLCDNIRLAIRHAPIEHVSVVLLSVLGDLTWAIESARGYSYAASRAMRIADRTLRNQGKESAQLPDDDDDGNDGDQNTNYGNGGNGDASVSTNPAPTHGIAGTVHRGILEVVSLVGQAAAKIADLAEVECEVGDFMLCMVLGGGRAVAASSVLRTMHRTALQIAAEISSCPADTNRGLIDERMASITMRMVLVFYQVAQKARISADILARAARRRSCLQDPSDTDDVRDHNDIIHVMLDLVAVVRRVQEHGTTSMSALERAAIGELDDVLCGSTTLLSVSHVAGAAAPQKEQVVSAPCTPSAIAGLLAHVWKHHHYTPSTVANALPTHVLQTGETQASEDEQKETKVAKLCLYFFS